MVFHRQFYFIYLGFLAFLFLIINACKKNDFSTSRVIHNNLKEQRFFNDHRPSDSLVKSLLAFVRNQHDKYDIVSELVENAGYPIWDKAISFSTRGSARNNNDDSDSSVTFIPFVKDSQNFVSATLVIKSESRDTSFKMLYDFQYKEYPFSAVSDDFTARDIFNIFVSLDKQVFDRKIFEITDGRLIDQDTSVNFIAILDTSIVSETTTVLTPQVICNTFTIYAPCSYFRTSSYAACILELQYETCTTVWEATNEFPPGGGGGWSPPPGPCGSNRSPNPCEPGWIPYPYQAPNSNPCDHVFSYITDNDFKSAINSLKTKTSANKEYGRLYRTTGLEAEIESPSNSCEVGIPVNPNVQGQIKCHLHSHWNNCFPIFSPGDLLTLQKLLEINENNYSNTLLSATFSMVLVTKAGNDATEASVYVLVIEDMETFATFAGDHLDDHQDISELDDLYRKNFNIGRGFSTANNEQEFLRFLKKIGPTGLRLMKASSDLNSYELLSLNRNEEVISKLCD